MARSVTDGGTDRALTTGSFATGTAVVALLTSTLRSTSSHSCSPTSRFRRTSLI